MLLLEEHLYLLNTTRAEPERGAASHRWVLAVGYSRESRILFF